MLRREGVVLTRSTIHSILLRHDLVRDEDRRTEALQRFERGAPNELWQMDCKGCVGTNCKGCIGTGRPKNGREPGAHSRTYVCDAIGHFISA